MSQEQQILWTAGFLNERLPAPISPLGWSVLGPLFEELALRDPLRYMGYPEADDIPATRLWHGHPYANVIIFQIMYSVFPDRLMPTDAIRYFPQRDISLRKRAPYPGSIPNPRFVATLLAEFAKDPINWSPFNVWVWERHKKQHDRQVSDLNNQLDTATEPEQVLTILNRANALHADLLKIHRWSLTYADIFYKLLTLFAADDAQQLVSGVPNVTEHANHDLNALAYFAQELGLSLDSDEAIQSAIVDEQFESALARVTHEHGHRSFSLDIAESTFADDPCRFLCLVTAPGDPPAAKNGWRQVARYVRARMPLWQRPFFGLILRLARRYAGLREDQRYYWHKSLAVSRRGYLLLAQFLKSAGLDKPDDIFFATQVEISSYFSGRLGGQALIDIIRDRMKEWALYFQEYLEAPNRSYPDFLKGDEPLDIVQESNSDAWSGAGISPGEARGRARVILDVHELGQVASGEILVAPAADPGWTPVFGRLAGLVLERGAVLAHSAIVAREHRLPAVSGLPNISREIQTGDWLELDGTRGTVRRIKQQPDEQIKSGSSRPAA